MKKLPEGTELTLYYFEAGFALGTLLEEFLSRRFQVWAVYAGIIGGVLLAGYAANKRKKYAGSAAPGNN